MNESSVTDSDFDFYVEVMRDRAEINPKKIIKDSRGELARSGRFTKFVPIVNARVPILKCVHVQSGINCDLNFSDSLGVLNSPIMCHLLQFDSRIYVLATIIKYWMKIHECTGSNFITNYAALWMLLFYLQTLPEPILPPIIEFQKNAPEYLVSSFNFGFNYQLPNLSNNRMRCSELLHGFFEFYRKFDFENHVICPLYGKTIPKADVKSKSVPEFQRYEEILNGCPDEAPMSLNKPLCIQDPFEITHSIPGLIAQKAFKDIVAKLGLAADIIKAELSSSGESTRLLLELFDTAKFEAEVKIRNPDDSNFTKNAVKTTWTIKPNEFELSIMRKILAKKRQTETDKFTSDDVCKSWTRSAARFVLEVIRDVFRFEIKVKKVSGESEQMEEADIAEMCNATADEIDHEIFVFGACDVFYARRLNKDVDGSTLQKEIDISRERFDKTPKVDFRAKIKITANADKFDQIDLEIGDLIRRRHNNYYRSFCMTLKNQMQLLLKIYFAHELEHNKSTPPLSGEPLSEPGSDEVPQKAENAANNH